VLRRGDVVLAEARGVRVFAARDPQDPRKIRAIPVPPDIRELCE
jgi:4-hydroxybenzoyl-CoA thioesterase